jgi:hypothetical protein
MKVKIGNYPKGTCPMDRLFGGNERKVSVRIDRHDTISMDDTLAYIILPMLYQLAKTKDGSPDVDLEDVPFELQGDHEDAIHERWDWVMAEMIYAFEEKTNDWEERFFCSEREYDSYKAEMDQIRGRISNGFRLFGKYYEGLWT